MAQHWHSVTVVLLLCTVLFSCAVSAQAADEAVVEDRTNAKGHLPKAEEPLENEIKAEKQSNGNEFTASPGIWLREEDKLSRNVALQRFVGWLRDEGSSFAPIALDSEGEGKGEAEGIRAEEELPEGTVLATVPLWTLLSTATPNEDLPDDTPYCDLTRRWDHMLVKQLFTKPGGTGSDEEKAKAYIHPSRGGKVLLTLCLIHEMKKEGGSFWQPFLDTLPRGFQQPITWSDEALEALQTSPLAGAVADARTQLAQDYRVMAKTLFTGFTRDQFFWAMLVVASRVQELHLPSRPRPVKALLPLFEFLPIDNMAGATVEVVDAADGGVDMLSFTLEGRAFDKDTPVTRTVPGCWNSQCLLLNHGILPEAVDFDYLPLSVVHGEELAYQELLEQYCEEEDLTEEVVQQKMEILTQSGLSDVAVSQGGNAHMMAAFRVLVMTAEEVEKTLAGEVDLSVVVSEENEARVAQLLSEMIFHTLSAYGTSAAEDRTILEELEEGEVALAVEMRLREKTLLLSVLQRLLKESPTSVYVPAVHLVLREAL